jgi:hypothetical protein
MKRAIVALFVTILLGIFSPGLPTLAQPLKIPHENPATARKTPIERDLLTTYSDIIDLAARSQYASAQDMLRELKQASVPSSITLVFDQYSGLFQQLLTHLDSLESQLDEIATLLAANQVGQARERLKTVETAIKEARSLVKDIEAATAGLDEKLGAFGGLLPDDPLARAHDRLQQEVGRLTDIIDSYDSIKRDLDGRYAELAKLEPVELDLDISPSSAFVGDTVTAAGRLVSRGGPLSGRTVAIVTGGTTLATSATTPGGSYKVPVAVPYGYTDSVEFTAVYEPAGGDAAVYLGAQSQPVAIATSYYPSQLVFSLPESIYPGTAFTLTGQVSRGEGPGSREITVTLDGKFLASAAVAGQFSLEISPPRGTPAGRQQLTITLTPQGRYSGASDTRWTTVAIMNRQVRAETPSIILLRRAVRVRGAVYNGPEPAGGAPVNLGLNHWQTTAVTAPDGTFQAEVPLYSVPPAAPLAGNPFYVNAGYAALPFNLFPIGWQDLIITSSDPGSPSGTFEMKKRIVSVNPLTAGLLAAMLAAAWVLVYQRQRKTEQVSVRAAAPERPAVTTPVAPLPVPVPRLTGIRGKVLAAYRSGLSAVEKVTGLVMGPDTTLREFLKTAPLPSPDVRDNFTELTGIAESTLYSRGDPRRDTAARAEELARTIKEDLDRGAA